MSIMKPEISVSISGIISLAALFFLNGAKNFVIIVICAAVHEAGHLFAMFMCGVSPCVISVGFFNFNIKYNKMKTSYKADIIISSFGIIFNLAFALVSYFLGSLDLFCTNIVLAVLNLLPISGLDGGNILSQLLSVLKKDSAKTDNCQYSGKMRLYSKIISPVCICFFAVISGFNLSVTFSGVSLMICDFINSG